MKSHEIAALINEIYEGVERSKVGSITGKDDLGKTTINHIPYNTFLTVLSSLTPKNLDGKITGEIKAEDITKEHTQEPKQEPKPKDYCSIGSNSCTCGWQGSYPRSGCPLCNRSFIE